ncbi:hypothetical protein RQN30_09180 [Arcanobacterium hippocoleae]
MLVGLPNRQISQFSLVLVAVLGILAALLKDYHWIAFVAAFGILLTFVLEMFRKKVRCAESSRFQVPIWG